MAMIAPASFFFLIAWLFHLHGAGRRQCALLAAAAWGVLVVVITEALSLFHALAYLPLLCSWIVAAVCAAALVFHRIRLHQPHRPDALAGEQIATGGQFPEAWKSGHSPAAMLGNRLDRGIGRGLIAVVILIVAVTGIAGVASAPANSDSMTYHLARVMHWIYNRSVDHYPAGFLPQLYHAPWAEFAILHFQLLSGGDRFAFGVQWLAMVGSLAAVSLIARRLGAGPRGQLLAAVFAATLPAGMVQAESTQNNYVPAFWILCFIVAILALRAERSSPRLRHAVFAGCALGLAMLTKGTAYLFVLPFLAWFAFVAITGKRPFAILVIVATLALSLNLPHWLRNYRCFGTPLIPSSEASWYRVEGLSLKLWASNIVGELTLQFGPPGADAAAAVQAKCTWLFEHLGLDPGDPRIMFRPHSFVISRFDMNEDCISNPVHLLVMAVVGGGLLLSRLPWNRRQITPRSPSSGSTAPPPARPGFFLALVLLAFLAFCAGIKWTRFNGRLELTVFVLAAAPVGAALERLKGSLLATMVAVILTALAIPILLLNPTHPLIRRDSIFKHSREQHYFAMRLPLGRSSVAAADLIARCAPHGPVGLAAHHEWEYTWWALLRNRGGDLREIVPLPVEVVPRGYSSPDPGKMSAIIVMDPALLSELTAFPRGPCAGWNRAVFERCTVLWPADEQKGHE